MSNRNVNGALPSVPSAMTTLSTQRELEEHNRPFIPPSQPRQNNSSGTSLNNNYQTQAQAQAPQPNPKMPDQNSAPQPRPRPPPSTQNTGHSRSSSFFSFRRNSNPSSPQQALLKSAANTHNGASRPPNANAGGPVNEFGGIQQQQQQNRTSTYSTYPSNGPTPPEKPLPQQQHHHPLIQRNSNPQLPKPELPPLHPEIRSIVQLTLSHPRKVYFSGPLVKRIERLADGSKPKDGGWTEVWAQLGGTTLSVWDMKMISEASKEGREVPPTYINMTDAFIQVLGSVTEQPSNNVPPQRYTNILTLNNAGSNLLLFSCPSIAALLSWAAALRLSAWEKSRLEELYTAHLLRVSIRDAANVPSPLFNGRMEGWVRIRLAGQTDWRRFYMVVSGSASTQGQQLTRSTSLSDGRGDPPHFPPHSPRHNRRISNLFSRDSSAMAPLPPKPTIALYVGNKTKERKAPMLTMREVTQAFAVYPEKPELIDKSTIIKLEGLMGGEGFAGAMKNREAWMFVMPEQEGGNTHAGEMLRWITAFHDAFEIYGRPRSYSWDPRDPDSLMFGYPVAPNKEALFLDREAAELTDPREDRTSTVRSRLQNILFEKMRGFQSGQPVSPHNSAPSLPPIQGLDGPLQQQEQQNGHADGTPPQLPSFDFTAANTRAQNRGALTPITERTLESVDVRNSRSMSMEKNSPQGRSQSGDQILVTRASLQGGPSTVMEESGQKNSSVFGVPVSISPPPNVVDRRSEDSSSVVPTSILSPSSGPSKTSGDTIGQGGDVASNKGLPAPPQWDLDSQGPSMGSGSPADPPKVSLDDAPQRPGSPSFSVMTSPYSVISPTAPASPQASILTSPHSMVSPSEASTALTSPHSVQSADRSGSPARFSVLTSPHSRPSTADRSASPARLSVLTSPHSRPSTAESSKASLLTSPYSPVDESGRQNFPSLNNFLSPDSKKQPAAAPPEPSTVVPSSAISPSTEESPQSLFDEAGALYYMQHFEDEVGQKDTVTGPRRIPTTISEGTDESTDDSTPNNMSPRQRSPCKQMGSTQYGAPGLLDRHMTSASMASSSLGGIESTIGSPVTSHSVIGRKPSGARVAPTRRKISAGQKRVSDEDSQSDSPQLGSMSSQHQALAPTSTSIDDNTDALLAMSFLDQDQSPKPAMDPVVVPPPPPPPPPHIVKASSPPPASSEGMAQYRSSFAPSRQAAERKARLQAQEAATHAAAHKPGRANGKQKRVVKDGAEWAQSSDEEEEEEEDDDDDDADSDSDQRPRVPPSVSPIPPPPGPVRPLNLRGRDVSPNGPTIGDVNSYPRQSRGLPPIPGRPVDADLLGYHNVLPPSRRVPSDQYSEANTRSYHDPGIRPQSEYPQPGAARQQNMWSQVLDPGQNPAELQNNNRDTFVQIEPPSQTMTKAFMPQGLLSAGLQDKQDRSAKKQEEIARESGASLINVPNKPPPPQTGLLGAITAHERERKREGGVGAALTEREREKRVVEERQRKIDELQRQQLEMVQNGAGSMSMYQHPQYTGYNPMMGNPMMMPMNPMMTGMNPMMGYPGMMPGFANPQHMFAAQQAAAYAYQQAMVALSTAGSQVPGDGEGHGGMAGGGAPPINAMNPMMTGGGMSMYDPRMSMGLPMMGSPYHNPMGGQPGMQYSGMPGGMMPGMNMMGMQMTGGSAFDPRFSPTAMENGGLQPPGPFQGQAQGPSSRNSSPAGRVSPARPTDFSGARPSSGHSSPRPPPQ